MGTPHSIHDFTVQSVYIVVFRVGFFRFLRKTSSIYKLLEVQYMKKSIKGFVGSIIAVVVTLLSVTSASAANVKDALSESGISKTGDMSGIYGDLNNVVYFVMALGGFWIVGMLVWGGMTLAGSGGNPQKRTEGFIKLSLVLVGAYIIFKAYDIASWATGLGGA